MSNNVQVFKNEMFEIAAKNTENGIEFEVESVAKCLGWTQRKNGKDYIRFETINKHLATFNFPNQVGKGDYILESYLYLLMMRSDAETALNMQKWIAFDVLPAIHKNKVYIDPSATDEEIDNAVRFSTPQKRRNALMEATIDGKQSVYVVYDNIKDYISKWSAKDKLTVLKHVERTLLDKKDGYGKDVAFVHKVEELLRQVAKDIDKVNNWKNGATKRELNKENKKLKKQIDYLNPSVEQMYKINYHPFSENYMYELVTLGGKTAQRKSKAYLNWLDKFPVNELPDIFELDLDFNRDVELICLFEHMSKFDVINLDKSFADLLAYHYNFNDNVIVNSTQKTNGHVNKLSEGKIYFLLRNV